MNENVNEVKVKEEKKIIFSFDKDKAEDLKVILKENGMSMSVFLRLCILEKIDFENKKMKEV